MAMFNAGAGWLYLVFGNQNDVYDLPSYARIGGRERYLYLCLKKAGYKNVFFWPERELCFDTDAEDTESKEALQSVCGKYTEKKGCLLKKSTLTTEEVFTQRFRALLRCKTASAIVASGEAFCRFFGAEDPETQQRIAKVFPKPGGGLDGNILVLTFPNEVGRSNKLLTDESSVLREISKGIDLAAQRTITTNLYDVLRDHLGSCCVYLNELSLEQIGNTVRRVIMMEPENIAFSEDPVAYCDQLSELIFRLYHSHRLREAFRYPLPENPEGSTKKIDYLLREPGFCREAERMIGGQKDNRAFSGKLDAEYPSNHEDKRYPVYDPQDSVLRRIKQMQADAGAVERKSLQTLHDAFCVILYRGDQELRPGKIDTCMELLKSCDTNNSANNERADKLVLINSWVQRYYDVEDNAEALAWLICKNTSDWIAKLSDIRKKKDTLQAEQVSLLEEIEICKREAYAALSCDQQNPDPLLVKRLKELLARENAINANSSRLESSGKALMNGIEACLSIARDGRFGDADRELYEAFNEKILGA